MADPQITEIDRVLKERGLPRAEVGRRLGLDSAQVSRLFNGRRKLQLHEYRTLAEWLGLEERVASGHAGQVMLMPGMIPLFGSAGAAGEDQLTLAEATMLGTVSIHPAQMNLRNAFAVKVAGESMSPRYEHGEAVYVAANQWPAKGQDCVIETNNSVGYLKRYKRRQGTMLVFEQFNPSQEVEFDVADVKALHAVVGRG